MRYRRFGKLDWQASALGFGCMRFPTLDGDYAKIAEPEATRMLHLAIEHGVNYLDTAYPYHGGNGELFVGRALKNDYRKRVRLATKMPCWLVKTAADFDKYLNEQLGKLQTDHIDFYLLHALSGERWPQVRDLGVLEWAERAIADGRIGHIGFSFHDKYAVFQEIIDAYDGWTFCQIQYNYMDVKEQAGIRGLQYAAARGLAVVIMEPLLGGRLANPPEAVQEIWDAAPTRRAPADWGLRWLWNQAEVSVVLSGMSAMQHVTENIASAENARINSLTEPELALIDRVRTKYQEICPVPCTRCEYCLPCPNEVNIPRLFELLNHGVMYNELERARKQYQELPETTRADMCIQCLQCESLCPQGIPISEWLVRVDEILGQGQPYELRATG
ncbi:MAG: aldo/keto reductase [Anaerolineae bacterium CG2_30_64_16]|nr:MAG: aldo/keto reductase [Anaerolineae bacterium CG2_30_64_16]